MKLKVELCFKLLLWRVCKNLWDAHPLTIVVLLAGNVSCGYIM